MTSSAKIAALFFLILTFSQDASFAGDLTYKHCPLNQKLTSQGRGQFATSWWSHYPIRGNSFKRSLSLKRNNDSQILPRLVTSCPSVHPLIESRSKRITSKNILHDRNRVQRTIAERFASALHHSKECVCNSLLSTAQFIGRRADCLGNRMIKYNDSLRREQGVPRLLGYLISGVGHSLKTVLGSNTLLNTYCVVDFYAKSSIGPLLTAIASHRFTFSSMNDWKNQSPGSRKIIKKHYSTWGVSNSPLFGGYNPGFGGWNGSLYFPFIGSFGCGLFVGGPYAGFFLSTPWFSVGDYTTEDKSTPSTPIKKRSAPGGYASVSIPLPIPSICGVSFGTRLLIYSPALTALVRPLKCSTWRLHDAYVFSRHKIRDLLNLRKTTSKNTHMAPPCFGKALFTGHLPIKH